MAMRSHLMGLDLGFNQTKIKTRKAHYKFPSIIGDRNAVELEQVREERDVVKDLRVAYDNETYYVGEKAYETNNARGNTDVNKTNSLSEKIIYYASLGIIESDGVDISSGLSIVTGLPVDDISNEQLKRDLIKQLSGHHSFNFRGKLLEASIRAVIPIPQAAGAFFDYILDENGDIDPSVADVANGIIIIIDVGYKTTDVITMKACSYDSQNSFTIEKGMRDVHKELRRIVKKELQINIPFFELDKACRDGYVSDRGIKIDINKYIDEAKRPICQQILSEISSTVNLRSANKIGGTGGTMSLFNDQFKEAFGSNYIKLNNPEYSNANGYYKYALMLEKAEGIEDENIVQDKPR